MRDGLGKGDCCLVRGEKQLFDAQPNVERIKSGRGRWFYAFMLLSKGNNSQYFIM